MKMKKVDVTWSPAKKSLSQMYSSGIEYAFLSEKYEMIHQPVYCKDYMQDAIAGFLCNKKMTIYGFTYDPKTDIPIYLKKTRLLITDMSFHDLEAHIPASLEFIRQIESELKMIRTNVKKVNEVPDKYKKTGAFVYDGSPRWMISPPMISLYTLLIRVSLKHKINTPYMDTINGIISGKIDVTQNSDKYQISSAIKGLQNIIKYSDKIIFNKKPIDNYSKNKKALEVDTMHNHMGIVAFSSDKYSVNAHFPEWYEKIKG